MEKGKLILIGAGVVGVSLISAAAFAGPSTPPGRKLPTPPSRKPGGGGGGGGGGPKDNARDISALEPEMYRKYLELERRLAAKGIKLLRGRTRASQAEGRKNFAEGKSSIASGISWHLLGRAIDVYPFDPKTGKPDMAGKNKELYRLLHREWYALGGHGLAFLPYPNGPVRYLKGQKGKYWDGGHLEFHGPYKSLAQAYAAEKKLIPSAYA